MAKLNKRDKIFMLKSQISALKREINSIKHNQYVKDMKNVSIIDNMLKEIRGK